MEWKLVDQLPWLCGWHRNHLNADSSGSLTQRQDRVVLGSVQPVDSQFGASGPFHHGDIIFPPKKTEGDSTSPPLTTSTRLRKCCRAIFSVSHTIRTVPAVTHPILGSSGFFITTVCRGPLRLTTDRCTTGFSSPACRGQEEITQVTQNFAPTQQEPVCLLFSQRQKLLCLVVQCN